MHNSGEEQCRAAYRESGRAIAVALIGFTLQAVSILPTSEKSGTSTVGFTAFKERSDATLDELTFIAAAGIWAESLASTDGQQEPDVESILGRLSVGRGRIDKGKMKFGLDYLTKNYRTAVPAIAQRLLQQKIIDGVECGQVILAHRPIPERKRV